MGFYFAQLLTGLANASSLFLIASGLSVIFGVTRIVNFAHGSFYMVGAYLAYSLVVGLGGGVLGFWFALLVAGLAVALLGVLTEILILRRLYHAPELFQMVATFGLALIIQDLVYALWGAADRLGPRAPGLDGAIRIFGEPIPEYDLALIVVGPLVLGLSLLVLHKTRWGLLVRAATLDRHMVGALGVNQSRLFTSAFAFGAFLAGLGGALQIPREAINLQMDINIIAEAFVVVVVGGMGSIGGAFIAAILISVLNAFAVLVWPQITLILPFLVMAITLILRPHGLFGKPGSEHGAPSRPEQPLKLGSTYHVGGVAILIAMLAAAPLFVGDFTLILLVDLGIAILFAVSLHFLMGLSGLVSFGHAAYFGLGAYGAAMAVKLFGFAMPAAMVTGIIAAIFGAAVFGWFCVRLSGVYLAMLTLAAAQILWGVIFQWQAVTGGDDGIVGIWPEPWASSDQAYFYISLILCLGGIIFLRRVTHASLGYSLRGGRDSPLRAEAIGIDLKRHQWLGFTIAGGVAGLAGSVFVFAKGSVFPDALGISESINGLIMVLLGGVQSVTGPIWGAVVFVLVEDRVSRLSYWRFIFGVIILVVALAAPDGIAGGLRRIRGFLMRMGRRAP